MTTPAVDTLLHEMRQTAARRTTIPTPRPPLDDELTAQRAVAAAATVADRRAHDGLCAALAAVVRLQGADVGTLDGAA